jgi:signal transduction histidine kinase
MSVVCKSDKGHFQANYSGLLGGLASGGISNLYYPAASRNGVSLTFENFGIGIAESAVENIFQEFVVRKLTPKLPKFSSPQP